MGECLVGPLLVQWRRIVAAAPDLDLERASRVRGWRNRKVLAHLAVQPRLLRRFLDGPDPAEVAMDLATNLAGTVVLASAIDQAARDAAAAGHLDLAAAVASVEPVLRDAAPDCGIVTVQGALRLSDYLRTRLVEAVVHGLDFDPPVRPDPHALEEAAAMMRTMLAGRCPGASPPTEDPVTWLELATGRRVAPPEWADVPPLAR